MNTHKTREFKVRFITPAFLGSADRQKRQWRAPPFKSALRQWWRVAVARATDYNCEKLREAEGSLFGHARPGSGSACRSQVELRLDGVSPQRVHPRWPSDDFDTIGRVRSDCYLGYGPISHTQDPNSYLSDKELATFRLRFPGEYADCLDQVLRLMTWFGTLGSRSRNGWGSLQMKESGGSGIPQQFSVDDLSPFLRDLSDCLKLDWPHAIGRYQGRPLVWQSTPENSWMKAINRLAELKVAMRDSAKKYKSNSNGKASGIHLLGYPAGGQLNLNQLGNNARLASPIRFKVYKDENDQYRSRVFHLPTDFPKILQDKLSSPDRDWIKENQMEVFQAAHQIIDQHANGIFRRIDR